MSRAYRIKIAETMRRIIRAEDHVKTQLELLQVMPAEIMAELLAQELEKEGFNRDGDVMTREENDVTVEVDLKSATVTVRTATDEQVTLEKQKSGIVYDDVGDSKEVATEKLRKQAIREMEDEANEETARLQKEVTGKLEAVLGDIRQQLDRATNKAIAEALKKKAAQMGQIREIQEDEQTGEMTIIVEV